MNIAVVTGASSGMGREFVRQLSQKDKFDEIWVIARRRERLESLQQEIDCKLRILPYDLTKLQNLEGYQALLNDEKPNVKVLVNCSGFAKFGRYDEIPVKDSMDMIDLNCKALVYITEATLPFMSEGAHIVQLDSLSAFQPIPYLNVYAATKAFVLSYSKALNVELEPRKIKVLAVCPGWVKTEFIDKAKQTSKNAIINFNKLYEAKDIVSAALKDMYKGKSVSAYGFSTKLTKFSVKILPHRFVMYVWNKQQKH